MKLKKKEDRKSFKVQNCSVVRRGSLLRIRGSCPQCGAKNRMYHVGHRWYTTRMDKHNPNCTFFDKKAKEE